MHRSHIIACLLALAATAACGDDAPKTTISDDTEWQVGCVSGSTGCTSLKAHRTIEAEDLHVEVTCRKLENGLEITLNDPGVEPTSSTQTQRPYGKVQITGLDPKTNRCSVLVTEQEQATGGELVVKGQCGDSSDRACKVTGKLDSGGWDFDGTLLCEGLNFKNVTVGLGPYTLQKPGSGGDAMVLQVANCQ